MARNTFVWCVFDAVECHSQYFERRTDALECLRDLREWRKNSSLDPRSITIDRIEYTQNRAGIADLLNRLEGY